LDTQSGRREEGGGRGTFAEPEPVTAWLAAAETTIARINLRV
jgi:hypothetical protein